MSNVDTFEYSTMDKDYQLMVACGDGELDRVKRLVDEGVDVNSKDFDGGTPLMEAAHDGNVDITRFLLDRGADVDAKADNDETALHDAAGNGNDAAARLLIERGASMHMKCHDAAPQDYYYTPLDVAKTRNRPSTAAIIETAAQSIKVIYTSSQDLQRYTVTFKDFNTNVIILTENDIPDGFELEGKPTFTQQYIQQIIDRLLTIDYDDDDDDTSSNQQEYAIDNLLAQHHPAIYQRMQYWGMNLLHLMVYFPQYSNNGHASLNLENGDTDDKKQILSSLLDLYPPQAIASVDVHGMSPLHHATINLIQQKMMSQECYELLLTRSPSIVVHRAIQAGMGWDQLRPIIMAKLNALTVEDEETGLVPFMIAAEIYHKGEESAGADDMLLGSLNIAYDLLCLQPDVLKEYDVSINTAKRSYKDMSGF